MDDFDVAKLVELGAQDGGYAKRRVYSSPPPSHHANGTAADFSSDPLGAIRKAKEDIYAQAAYGAPPSTQEEQTLPPEDPPINREVFPSDLRVVGGGEWSQDPTKHEDYEGYPFWEYDDLSDQQRVYIVAHTLSIKQGCTYDQGETAARSVLMVGKVRTIQDHIREAIYSYRLSRAIAEQIAADTEDEWRLAQKWAAENNALACTSNERVLIDRMLARERAGHALSSQGIREAVAGQRGAVPKYIAVDHQHQPVRPGNMIVGITIEVSRAKRNGPPMTRDLRGFTYTNRVWLR